MEEEEDVETNRGSDNWGRLDNQEHSCCPDHLSETAILRREDLSDHPAPTPRQKGTRGGGVCKRKVLFSPTLGK